MVSGRFSSSGLSGDFNGEYDWNKNTIIGFWKSANDKKWYPLSLPIISQSPWIFLGMISGTTSSSTGKVPFTIKPEIEVQLQKKWSNQGKKMSGIWGGTADGTWSVVINTPLGKQSLSGNFSEPVNGTWNGDWKVGINSAGELAGIFDGVFSGTAYVSILTPIGNLNIDIPVNGVHMGGIMISSAGDIEFNGVWHELLETHNTSGTVLPDNINDGYGGQLSLLVKVKGTDILVDGPVQGGGQYIGTQTYSGVAITVSYNFSGNFKGSLDYP